MGVTRGMMSSLRDDWETPQDLFDALDARYGFTVDVCANDGNAKCARYYTADDDGLSKSWEGEVAWCNPPYGRAIAAWARKCAEESRRARVVMLCAARPDTRWFAEHVAPHARVAFVVGRLRFERGGRRSTPPRSQACSRSTARSRTYASLTGLGGRSD